MKIAFETALQANRVLRVQFDGRQAILLAQKVPRDQWRTGIELQACLGIAGTHRVEIRRERRHHLRTGIDAGQPSNAVPPLAGLLRFRRREIVEPDACMRIHDTEGFVLAFQIFDQARQHDMLDDVSEISGMIDVAIVHGFSS